jgi:hypothetical protein
MRQDCLSASITRRKQAGLPEEKHVFPTAVSDRATLQVVARSLLEARRGCGIWHCPQAWQAQAQAVTPHALHRQPSQDCCSLSLLCCPFKLSIGFCPRGVAEGRIMVSTRWHAQRQGQPRAAISDVCQPGGAPHVHQQDVVRVCLDLIVQGRHGDAAGLEPGLMVAIGSRG